MIVNKAQLADFLGRSEQALTEWQDEGLPIAARAQVRGQANQYDTAAVVAWLLERAIRKARVDDPKAELYRSQTRLNNLKIAEQEERLVDVEAVEMEYGRLIFAARARLLQLPARIAQLPGGETLREAAEELVYEALKELSEYEPEADSSNGSSA